MTRAKRRAVQGGRQPADENVPHLLGVQDPEHRFRIDARRFASAGAGRVESVAGVTQAVHPLLADRVPYVIALIAVTDAPGVLIAGNVLGKEPDAVRSSLPSGSPSCGPISAHAAACTPPKAIVDSDAFFDRLAPRRSSAMRGHTDLLLVSRSWEPGDLRAKLRSAS